LDILALLLLKSSHPIDHFYGLNNAEELLGIEFRSTLIDMHSLVWVPPPSGTDAGLPRVYHASLEDFLMDQSRSHQYYIGRRQGHLRLSRYWLKAMGRFPYFEHLMLQDVVLYFGRHAKQSSASEDLANDLAQFDLKAVLEKISNFRKDLYNTDWQIFFDGSKHLVSPNNLEFN
jgi:hypothetical protein